MYFFFLSSQSAVYMHACALVVYRVCIPQKYLPNRVCIRKENCVYLVEHGYSLEESLPRSLDPSAESASAPSAQRVL